MPILAIDWTPEPPLERDSRFPFRYIWDLPDGMSITDLKWPDPAQAEGTYGDLVWSFRARQQHWQLHIAKKTDMLIRNDLFYIDCPWPGPLNSAGFMTPRDIERCLAFAIDIYEHARTHD